jgi:superfamily II DNA or RNA helicase
MPALHYRSSHWIHHGLFASLASFAEFESRVNAIPEEKDRGDVFEIFVEGYLATQAIAQSRQHWVVGSIPSELRELYKLPNDGTGIDGIYKAHDGSHVAYQVKYRQKANLTYQEVAPFLGLTEQFSDRVIFTNATTLAHQALPRTRWVSRQDFAALSPEALSEICGWITEKPARQPRATPDPHYQTQVLEDIAKTLETNSRATVVMACGSGKTLVALWAVEQATPKSVLVLLPSLSLVQQTVREWTRHTNLGSRFRFICVCSDDTVAGKRDSDALELDTTDLGFRVDTDPTTVNRFLSAADDAVRVVFSTYQSAVVVSAGTKGLDPFDIGVFDEAHKTTGLAGGQFSRPLTDDHIRIRKRLFFTATPRHIDIRSKRDRDGEYKVQSMDDSEVYGPRAHTLSFKAAADKGIICPYKVVISVVDKQLIDDFTRKNGITLVDGDEIGTRWVSNLVALQQAIEQTGATKAITFHSRVNLANDFASDSPRGIGHYLDGFEVRHVNGKQRSSDRSDLIQAFAAASKSIITNARCLTEGVDIPAVDMVAFIDPRQSRVDIAQAVGRAMRKPRGKSEKVVGYVFVPLFVGEEGETIEDAITSERFDAVTDVLNALQEHDEELVDLIRELRQAKGEGKPFKSRITGEKIELIGPRVDLARVVESVETRIADQLGASWDEWFGLWGSLNRLSERKQFSVEVSSIADDAPVTIDLKNRLSHWERRQRHLFRRGELRAERQKLLREAGFDFDPFETQWGEAYESLARFHQQNRHSNVSSRDKDRRLARWVVKQRVAYRSKKLDHAKIRALRAIGFVFEREDFNRKSVESFSYIDAKAIAHSKKFINSNEYFDWARGAAPHYGEFPDKMPRAPQHVYRGKGWVSWDEFLGLMTRAQSERERWEKRLIEFQKHMAATDRDAKHPPDDKVLAQWISTQTQKIKKGQLSEEQIQRLSAAGFIVDARQASWERSFERLLRYVEEHGSGAVPQNYRSQDGYTLGAWVNYIRKRKKENSLSVEQVSQLERVRGWHWGRDK